MKIVNLHTLPEVTQASPKGRFGSHNKNISVALGARARPNEAGEPHPFDLQIRRIEPGRSVCPFHSHLTQWELFVVISGHGHVRHGEERHAVKPGDAFMQPPGVPHQITNTSTTEDLIVQIIANNPDVDISHYPDSDKYGAKPGLPIFRMQEVDYFDGEE